LVRVDDSGLAFVDFVSNPAGEPLAATTTVPLTEEDCSSEVILMFEDGDPRRPVVLGIVQSSVKSSRPLATAVEARVDGETVVISADKEIVLRCGKASITLTRAGKVFIRGAYLLNRSSGVNRIKGGSVQIN
jgi:hypothetical protein